MAPELFSEEIKPRQFQPAPSKIDFPFRRTLRNPAREVFEKLSLKLKGQDLPGIEFAGKYLSHLYSRNRRASTLEHNYISITITKERGTPTLLTMAGQSDWLQQRRRNRANLLECLRGSLGREKCRFDRTQ